MEQKMRLMLRAMGFETRSYRRGLSAAAEQLMDTGSFEIEDLSAFGPVDMVHCRDLELPTSYPSQRQTALAMMVARDLPFDHDPESDMVEALDAGCTFGWQNWLQSAHTGFLPDKADRRRVKRWRGARRQGKAYFLPQGTLEQIRVRYHEEMDSRLRRASYRREPAPGRADLVELKASLPRLSSQSKIASKPARAPRTRRSRQRKRGSTGNARLDALLDRAERRQANKPKPRQVPLPQPTAGSPSAGKGKRPGKGISRAELLARLMDNRAADASKPTPPTPKPKPTPVAEPKVEVVESKPKVEKEPKQSAFERLRQMAARDPSVVRELARLAAREQQTTARVTATVVREAPHRKPEQPAKVVQLPTPAPNARQSKKSRGKGKGGSKASALRKLGLK